MNDQESTPALSNFEGPARHNRWWLWCVVIVVLLALIVATGGIVTWKELNTPPDDFPTQKLIVIPSGATLHEIAILLKGERVIRSETAFAALVKYTGAESRLMAGDYLFPSALPLSAVVQRLVGGEHGIERLRVTIPEGTSATGMGRILKGTLPQLNEVQFVALAKPNEGYLFPDTYFFFSNATSGPIVDILKGNFLKKTDVLRTEAMASKKNWSDVIIMASIIEEETITPKDRRIVSGILWKRLAKGMHLGVDSPFAYDIGKNSATLTTPDLQIDSPYNTYRYGGLPPTPISNPGLDAIDAALHPETSPYYFFLSGKDGVIHYAKTFEEHKLNKEHYLR